MISLINTASLKSNLIHDFNKKHSTTISPTHHVKNTTATIQLKSGEEMTRELGILSLGGQKQLEEWASKGLVVTDQAITRAFEAFNKGAKEAFKLGGAGTSTSINRHQIIINSQDTPDWFHESYQLELKRLSHVNQDAAIAFKAGSEYYTEAPSEQKQPSSIINAYIQTAKL